MLQNRELIVRPEVAVVLTVTVAVVIVAVMVVAVVSRKNSKSILDIKEGGTSRILYHELPPPTPPILMIYANIS